MKMKKQAIHRKLLVKSYLSPDERKRFSELCVLTGLTQAEFIRQSIFTTKIEVILKPICPLDDLVALNAMYGKIGNNLNQIAKFLNQGGQVSELLYCELQQCLLDLFELKRKVLKLAGEFNGTD